MDVLKFADLDGCFWSKQPNQSDQSDRDKHPFLQIDFGQGKSPAFMQPKHEKLWLSLQRSGQVIPTTARTSKELSHVRVPKIDGSIAPLAGWAICSSGGVILQPNGNPEPHFLRKIKALLKKHSQEQTVVLAQLSELIQKSNIATNIWIEQDCGLNLYPCAKAVAGSDEKLKAVANDLLQLIAPGWQIHHNGCFLAAYPPGLNKASAVRWFLDNIATQEKVTIGIGDSFTDKEFLALCDYAIIPNQSQLHQSIFTES